MKSWLPHLFYPTLLLVGGLYYWQSQKQEQQLIAFLNQPTEDARSLLRQNNDRSKASIEDLAAAYINPRNVRADSCMRRADSLAKLPLQSAFAINDLRSSLAAMIPATDRARMSALQVRPRKSWPGLPADSAAWAHQDALWQQLALNCACDYYLSEVGTIGDRFDPYQPTVAYNTLCAPAGKSATMDIFLSGYEGLDWRTVKISVDGQSLPVKDGVVHLERTYPAPGIYPLTIEGQINFDRRPDSVLTAAKTFLLYVKR